MAYFSGAEFAATPHQNERPNLAKRIFGPFAFSRNAKADEVDVNALKDWDPIKLRSFGYTDVEIDYLFAKANQLK